MRTVTACLAIGAILTIGATAASAAPRLDGVMGDHAVIQRGQPIVLTGQAAAGETVMITLAGRSLGGDAASPPRLRATAAFRRACPPSPPAGRTT
jgi:sialate O-acetylesterase